MELTEKFAFLYLSVNFTIRLNHFQGYPRLIGDYSNAFYLIASLPVQIFEFLRKKLIIKFFTLLFNPIVNLVCRQIKVFNISKESTKCYVRICISKVPLLKFEQKTIFRI